MMGRKAPKNEVEIDVEPKGFDDFEVRLGDMMRGERATLGKSLLDVQRELRIKASYIAAIENADPDAFDTPGFIAGYVRSYARYLNMDPDVAFEAFCAESGFAVAHGMSQEASVIRKTPITSGPVAKHESDPFLAPNTPFSPSADSVFSGFEPRAIGSSLVLLALVAGIGYGGWTVLRQIQQVTVAPVEQAPIVLSDLDPLTSETQADANGALDRLYRPQALDVPVLASRDAPISSLDPRETGSFREVSPDRRLSGLPAVQAGVAPGGSVVPQVVEATAPGLQIVAVRPSWVRVSAADGSVIFEKIMDSGETYAVPQTEEAPTLRSGESGAIYFAMNGQHFGPAGPRGTVTSGVELSTKAVSEAYELADLENDADLSRFAQAPIETVAEE